MKIGEVWFRRSCSSLEMGVLVVGKDESRFLRELEEPSEYI